MSTQAVASAGAITQDEPDEKVDVVERIFVSLLQTREQETRTFDLTTTAASLSW